MWNHWFPLKYPPCWCDLDRSQTDLADILSSSLIHASKLNYKNCPTQRWHFMPLSNFQMWKVAMIQVSLKVEIEVKLKFTCKKGPIGAPKPSGLSLSHPCQCVKLRGENQLLKLSWASYNFDWAFSFLQNLHWNQQGWGHILPFS